MEIGNVNISSNLPIRPTRPSGGNASVSTPSVQAAPAKVEVQQIDSAQQRAVEQIEQGSVEPANIYVVGDSVFSLFKLPDGKIYSKVRNLQTGEIRTFPQLDTFTYNEIMRGGGRGALYEGIA